MLAVSNAADAEAVAFAFAFAVANVAVAARSGSGARCADLRDRLVAFDDAATDADVDALPSVADKAAAAVALRSGRVGDTEDLGGPRDAAAPKSGSWSACGRGARRRRTTTSSPSRNTQSAG